MHIFKNHVPVETYNGQRLYKSYDPLTDARASGFRVECGGPASRGRQAGASHVRSKKLQSAMASKAVTTVTLSRCPFGQCHQ